MTMTADQLLALPQSAFEDTEHPSGTRCCDCSSTRAGVARFHRVHIRCKSCGCDDPHDYSVCPSCYANHPEAPAARMYALTKSGNTLWCDGRYYGQLGSAKRHGASMFHTLAGALAAKLVGDYREIQEPEARAWAEKHGHADALFPGEDEAPAEDWPKWAVANDGACLHRFDNATKGSWACASFHDGDSPYEWSDFHPGGKEGTRYKIVTEPQARAYAAEHSIPWPAKWGEGVTPDAPTRPSGELPEVEQPSPEPQPVGYSCKTCGAMLVVERPGEPWFCSTCGHAWHSHSIGDGEPRELYAWVQPGPLPGPWEDTHEWTGEYRLSKTGEWYVGGDGKARQTGSADIPAAPRHILRPKAKPAEAGTNRKDATCKHQESSPRSLPATSCDSGAKLHSSAEGAGCGVGQKTVEATGDCVSETRGSKPIESPGQSPTDQFPATSASCTHATTQVASIHATSSQERPPTTAPTGHLREETATCGANGMEKPSSQPAMSAGCGDSTPEALLRANSGGCTESAKPMSAESSEGKDGPTSHRPGFQCRGCQHYEPWEECSATMAENGLAGHGMCLSPANTPPAAEEANPSNDCPHFTAQPEYEGNPSDCAFTGRESFLQNRTESPSGKDGDMRAKNITIPSVLLDGLAAGTITLEYGKDAPMQTITKTRFTRNPTCPKCQGRMLHSPEKSALNNLVFYCGGCGRVQIEMPTADSEPSVARKAAKWLAFAPFRLPWAILKRIPRTIGVHYDDPHPGRLWATIQMVVGGTIISSIPGAWPFIGSHTEWLWMAPAEWAQAAWSGVCWAAEDSGTLMFAAMAAGSGVLGGALAGAWAKIRRA